MATRLLLTDALADALADAIRHGVPIETASLAAGIAPRQTYEWLATAERGTWHDGTPVSPQSASIIARFAGLVTRAQAEFEASQVAGIAKAAEEVNEKTGVTDWRARAWVLNNHPRYRERYRLHRQLEVTGEQTIRHEHQLVKQLEPEALEAAYLALETSELEPSQD